MKVLLIDDHQMVNAGLASILEETGNFNITGQINSLTQAKDFLETAVSSKKEQFPSLIILDILLGDENGLDFLPFLETFCKKNKITKPPVLVCSILEETFRIQSALKMGASGYICKTGSNSELLNAIKKILNGETYIPNEYSTKVLSTLGLYEKFTKRELEIFEMIKINKTNKQISQELSINIRTVENHISNLYFKTGASNRIELLKL